MADLFGPVSTQREGWFEIRNDTDSGTFFVRGDGALTELDGAPAIKHLSKTSYLPILANRELQLTVVNPVQGFLL